MRWKRDQDKRKIIPFVVCISNTFPIFEINVFKRPSDNNTYQPYTAYR